MDKASVIKFAKQLGLQSINSTKRAGWVTARCPLAKWDHERGTDRSPSFGIRHSKRRDRCHCFSCGFSGDLEDLLLRLAILSRGDKLAAKKIRAARECLTDKPTLYIGSDDDEEEEDYDEIIEWPEWYLASMHRCYDHKYLAKRDGGPVPLGVAKLMDFRYDERRKRIGVPVRDFDGRLMGFHARDVTGKSDIKYLAYKYNGHYNRPIWLGEHWVDWNRPLLVVESVFDMARALQCYRNVVCPLYAAPPRSKVQRLSPAIRVVSLFDSDKAGQGGLSRLKKWLPDTKIISPGLPAGYKDPGEVPIKMLATRLKTCLPLDDLLLP